MQTTKITRSLRALLMAGAVAAVTAGAIATPALADNDDWHGRDGWGHEHAWRGDDDDWGRRPAYGYGYSYSYAYPYAYYPYYPYAYAAPAPVYTAPPSIDFVFPIHVR
ncbi:MAG: hypothetical protein KGI92_07145 [Alphaproteobacteria bacterium]|jgi:hypothetical protein|nr:hypothetical protein [Alphaproteobacteria bacterium]